MTSRELVSVLVPAFDHERYVAECLRALAAQTHRPLELLIRDDGSDDGTGDAIAAVLPEVAQAFDRVVFLRGDNLGTATNLNILLAHARGDYVFLNASDDVAEPRAVTTLLDALRTDPKAAMAVGDNAIIDADGRRIAWTRDRRVAGVDDEPRYRTFAAFLRAVDPSRPFERGRFGRLDTLRRDNHVPNGKLFRRAALTAVGGWMPGTVEDWDLNFRLARRHRLRYVDEVLFRYRWHDANTVNRPSAMSPAQRRTGELIRRRLRHPVVWLRVAVRRSPVRRLRARLNARTDDRAGSPPAGR